MRQTIVLAVLAITVLLFSPAVTAGKVEVCEEVKHDPAYKGLYGLCNAYWNADEEDREDILRNFERKAGPDGPGMPGLEDNGFFYCPCWSDVAYEDVCNLGDPINQELEADWVYADFIIYPNEEDVLERVFSFNSLPGRCVFWVQDTKIGEPPVIEVVYSNGIEGLSTNDHEQCRSEVGVIATLQKNSLCD